MAKAHVQLPSIGISVIDLGPAELPEIPKELAAQNAKQQAKAAFGFAIGQILKRGAKSGLTREDLIDAIKEQKSK